MRTAADDGQRGGPSPPLSRPWAVRAGPTAPPASPRAAGWPSALLAAGVAVLLGVVLFFGGGSSEERLFWIAAGLFGVLAVSCAAVLVARRPLVALTPFGAAFLLALAAFVGFNGLSIWWSIAPDRSWDYLNRGLVYLAFALLGLLLGALLPRAPQHVAGGLAILLAGVCAWALAGKVIPSLFPDGARVARLRNPIGYWNALGLAADLALPLFLWIAARRRDAAAVGIYLATVTVLLTYSRGGVVVGALAVAAWLALGIARRESLAALLVAVPAALVVSGLALALPGVVDDLQPHSVRVRDGAWFGLALLAGAAVVGLVARRDLGRTERRALAGFIAALVATGIGALAAHGGWLQEFRGADAGQVPQSAARIGSTSSNNRLTWWSEAWQVFEQRPLGGKGAATFELARRKVRDNSLVTTEPHNVALQFLAETGVAGLVLGAIAALAGVGGAAEALRRIESPEVRAPAAALAVAVPVYLLHALEDVDWDFVAVSAPVFLAVGVLVGAGRPSRSGGLWPAAVGLLALAAALSITFPWLAARKVDAAYQAIGDGHFQQGASDASSANGLNPFAVDPLWAWAGAESARGDEGDALRLYERAAIRQPENSSTWYELGAFEFETGRYANACRHLDIAYSLDPYGPAGRKGGLLDEVRQRLPNCPPKSS